LYVPKSASAFFAVDTAKLTDKAPVSGNFLQAKNAKEIIGTKKNSFFMCEILINDLLGIRRNSPGHTFSVKTHPIANMLHI